MAKARQVALVPNGNEQTSGPAARAIVPARQVTSSAASSSSTALTVSFRYSRLGTPPGRNVAEMVAGSGCCCRARGLRCFAREHEAVARAAAAVMLS